MAPEQTFQRLTWLPEALSWLDDPEIWKLLPQPEVWSERCYFRAAEPDKIQFPLLEWEPCGNGCSRAEIYQGHGSNAALPRISVAVRGGVPTPHLHVSQGGIGSSTQRLVIQRSIDLLSGRTVAAVQYVMRPESGLATCGNSYAVGSGLEAVSTTSAVSATPLHIQGSWDFGNNSWSWQLPWTTDETRGFSHCYCSKAGMEDGGRSFYFCGNVIRAAMTPGSSEITTFASFDGDFVVGKGAALSDLLVWPELNRSGPGSRVRAWSVGGEGIHVILDDMSVDTCAVGLSDSQVAGFSTAGGCDSFQPEGRLWVAKRSGNGALTDFRLSPIFWPEPVTAGGAGVHTWGDYVAVIWGEQNYDGLADRGRLLLARTTDWAMRDLRGPDGEYEVWESGLTSRYLYVIFTYPGAKVGQFSHVYRYDLDKFELIGNPIAPVQAQEQATPGMHPSR